MGFFKNIIGEGNYNVLTAKINEAADSLGKFGVEMATKLRAKQIEKEIKALTEEKKTVAAALGELVSLTEPIERKTKEYQHEKMTLSNKVCVLGAEINELEEELKKLELLNGTFDEEEPNEEEYEEEED